MGASREMTVAALAEPTIALAIFAPGARRRLDEPRAHRRAARWRDPAAALSPGHLLAFAALFIVTLAETGRLPVDNPATHLELTMIHEAMVLEYSGPLPGADRVGRRPEAAHLLRAARRICSCRGAWRSCWRRRRSRSPSARCIAKLWSLLGRHRRARDARRQAAAVPRARAAWPVVRAGVAGGHVVVPAEVSR